MIDGCTPGDDASLRELERRWTSSADAADGARWLAARVRAGLVEVEAIQDAAWVGDEAARQLHQDRRRHDDLLGPGALVRGLRSPVNAVLAAAEAVGALLDISGDPHGFRLRPVWPGARSRRLVACLVAAVDEPAFAQAERHLEAARLITDSGPADPVETNLARVIHGQMLRAEMNDLVLADLVRVAALSRSPADTISHAAIFVDGVASLREGKIFEWRSPEAARARFSRHLHERLVALVRRRAHGRAA